jgi:hypothetical protein
MDEGRVVQYGKPWELLEANEGPFARLVEQTGAVTAQYLRAMARQHHSGDGSSSSPSFSSTATTITSPPPPPVDLLG